MTVSAELDGKLKEKLFSDVNQHNSATEKFTYYVLALTATLLAYNINNIKFDKNFIFYIHMISMVFLILSFIFGIRKIITNINNLKHSRNLLVELLIDGKTHAKHHAVQLDYIYFCSIFQLSVMQLLFFFMSIIFYIFIPIIKFNEINKIFDL